MEQARKQRSYDIRIYNYNILNHGGKNVLFYLEFILITSYMVITYHIIALKYKKSLYFPNFTNKSKIFLVLLHVFIVISNISLYFWFIIKDFNPLSKIVSASGVLLFTLGLFFLFWSSYSLNKAVFIPGNELVVTGAYAMVRHPMYLGGITGAIGLALFAGSLFGFLYTLILALVLSHISNAEEGDLRARFGEKYVEYAKKVPRLLPRIPGY